MEILILKPVEEFMDALDSKTIAKIIHNIDLLKNFTYKLPPPYCKKISKNLHELRIRGNIEVRIFYTFKNQDTYLFHAYIKKTNKIPVRILETVRRKLKGLDI